jgi:rifampicin phosphotransferase
MPRYVINLSSRTALQPTLSGGKGAGLAWLNRQGANVPAGFVITTATFWDFLAAAAPEPGQIHGRPAAAAGGALQNAVETAEFPPPLARAILQAYRRLGGPVAVRSSATGEDARTASYAGQFSTVLHVEGEEAVLAAVRACWASLFAHSAAAYLPRQEALPPQDGSAPAMAVVVQRMVAATAAGVAFSADPLSGEFCTIIEAVHGLGDALVSGRAAADRYVIDAQGVLTQTTQSGSGAPVLSAAEVMHLAQIVRDLHARAGGPRDIEWAYDGAFHMLQCRPITSLAGRHVYSSRLTAAMAPGLVKPLVYSTNTHAMAREVFGKLFTELIGPNSYDFTQLTPLICSRVYADMTLMGELLGRVGLPPNFMEMMLHSERAERERKMHMDPRVMLAMGRMVRLAVRHGRLPPQQTALLSRQQARLEPYRSQDWSQAPLPELLDSLGTLVAYRNSTFWLFFVGVMGLAVRNALLRRWVERRVQDVSFNDLIRGLTGLRSLEPMRGIGRLAELARQLPPEARRDLSSVNPAEQQVHLAGSPAGEALLSEVTAFLDRFGYLSSNGSDFSENTWAENPEVIWRAVSRAAENLDAAAPAVAAAARAAAHQRVRAQLSPVSRLVFERLLASVTAAIDLRESLSLLMSEYSFQLRRLFLAIGDRLAAQGDLATAEDLFYLAYDELTALANGELPAGSAHSRIAERRARLEADAQVTPPSIISGDFDRARAMASPEPDGPCLTGIAGSAGTVQGRARIVHDPAAAPAFLGREDILIVPYSDVGWTPLFSSIGGIVTETGGQLSHAAIVAREYGLPAVVGVRNATRLIREGQPVSVDGNRGRVYLDGQTT